MLQTHYTNRMRTIKPRPGLTQRQGWHCQCIPIEKNLRSPRNILTAFANHSFLFLGPFSLWARHVYTGREAYCPTSPQMYSVRWRLINVTWRAVDWYPHKRRHTMLQGSLSVSLHCRWRPSNLANNSICEKAFSVAHTLSCRCMTTDVTMIIIQMYFVWLCWNIHTYGIFYP